MLAVVSGVSRIPSSGWALGILGGCRAELWVGQTPHWLKHREAGRLSTLLHPGPHSGCTGLQEMQLVAGCPLLVRLTKYIESTLNLHPKTNFILVKFTQKKTRNVIWNKVRTSLKVHEKEIETFQDLSHNLLNKRL